MAAIRAKDSYLAAQYRRAQAAPRPQAGARRRQALDHRRLLAHAHHRRDLPRPRRRLLPPPRPRTRTPDASSPSSNASATPSRCWRPTPRRAQTDFPVRPGDHPIAPIRNEPPHQQPRTHPAPPRERRYRYGPTRTTRTTTASTTHLQRAPASYWSMHCVHGVDPRRARWSSPAAGGVPPLDSTAATRASNGLAIEPVRDHDLLDPVDHPAQAPPPVRLYRAALKAGTRAPSQPLVRTTHASSGRGAERAAATAPLTRAGVSAGAEVTPAQDVDLSGLDARRDRTETVQRAGIEVRMCRSRVRSTTRCSRAGSSTWSAPHFYDSVRAAKKASRRRACRV